MDIEGFSIDDEATSLTALVASIDYSFRPDSSEDRARTSAAEFGSGIAGAFRRIKINVLALLPHLLNILKTRPWIV